MPLPLVLSLPGALLRDDPHSFILDGAVAMCSVTARPCVWEVVAQREGDGKGGAPIRRSAALSRFRVSVGYP